MAESKSQKFRNQQPDSTKPSVNDLIGWSERWARELWLCNSNALNENGNLDTSGWRIQLYHGKEEYKPPIHEDIAVLRLMREQEEETREEDRRLRVTEAHPDVREKANERIDQMMRVVGVTEDEIACMKQVLPYKLAHLYNLKHPKPKVETIKLWIYKKGIHRYNCIDPVQDLLPVALNIKATWPEVLDSLCRSMRPSSEEWNSRPLEDEPWEFYYIKNTKGAHIEKTSGSSGFLETSGDYKTMLSMIRDARTPHVSALLFQRNYSEKPLPIWPIDKILLPASPRGKPPQSSLLPEDQGANEEQEFRNENGMTFKRMTEEMDYWEDKHFKKPKKHGNSERQTPDLALPTETDYRDRKVMVWLQHDGVADDYLKYPECLNTVPQHLRNQQDRAARIIIGNGESVLGSQLDPRR